MKIANDSEKAIDAVLLWVNGNDPKYQKKMFPYVKDQQKLQSQGFKTRFAQVEEIKYSINSILKYAPFVRNIFIVTDRQTPVFLGNNSHSKKYNNVKIVDHTEIFVGYENYLPTFNSRSIETQIYKISGLAEHFIYFNDDMILINPTKSEDFFIDNKPVIRGKWLKFDENVFYKKLKKNNTKPKHNKAQQKPAKLLGLSKYYKFHHTPSPLRKSTFQLFFAENKELEIENIRYKFRNINQFLPHGLANHIEIKNKNCILKRNFQLSYIQSYKKPKFWYAMKLKKAGKNTNKLFLCIQSLELANKNIRDYILNWIDQKLKH